MPEDNVGLDAEPLEIEEASFEVPPLCGIGAVKIERFIGAAHKRNARGLVAIVGVVVWGKNRTGAC